MPWIPALCAAVLVGGCVFDADYGGGGYTCKDGRCPSGLVCHEQRCVATIPDAPRDTPTDDGTIDARMAALTCVDPGLLAPAGGSASGTTVGLSPRVSASCGGFVMNAPDNVYRITAAAAGDQYLISVTGLKAYVIAPCSAFPPSCLGNMVASEGNPIAVTTAFAGQHFIVVDHENAAMTGSYTLTVTKQ